MQHQISLLGDLVIILTLAAAAIWIFRKLRQPSIFGFIATGILIGPAGLAVMTDRHDIEIMAEIGVVLLLFTIGLEISLRDLFRLRRAVFGTGGLQVGLTAALLAPLLRMFTGIGWEVAIFIGLLVGLSSTAMVLKLMSDRGESATPQGRVSLAILLFQDLGVVFLILLVPLLAGEGITPAEAALKVGRALAILAAIVLASSFLFPWLLSRIVRARSRELFTIATMVAVFGTAYLGYLAGLSLAIGAFAAGIVVSESPYAHQMLSEIMPLRDVFNGLFFVSIGMLVDPNIIIEHPITVPALVLGAIVLKMLVTGAVVTLTGFGPRLGIAVGLSLAQVGEFSFVLAAHGSAGGLLTPLQYEVIVAVIVGTMLLTPILMNLAKVAAPLGDVLPFFRRFRPSDVPSALEQRHDEALENHVIIVGYGINGRNVARVLRHLDVQYVVLELNPATVREAQDADEPMIFGDATRDLVLEHVGIERARAIVVAIADAAAARSIVAAAKHLNPDVTVIVRTRLVAEVEALEELGADDVVPEEFETSIELAGRVLAYYGAPPSAILREKELIRSESYRALRLAAAPTSMVAPTLAEMLTESEIEVIRLAPSLQGQTLKSLDVRARTGASIIGIRRGGNYIANPSADFTLCDDDFLVVYGGADEIAAVRKLLSTC